jgi:hypothetical protein
MAAADVALAHPWTLWETGETLEGKPVETPVGEVSTVCEWWRLWLNYPTPSMLLTDGQAHYCVSRPKIEPDGEAREDLLVTTLSFFREGVLPRWEDPIAGSGGQLRFRGRFGGKALDAMWKVSCQAACGGVLGDVLGVRVVDHCSLTTRRFALELWLAAGPEGGQLGEEELRAGEDELCRGVWSVGARWRSALEGSFRRDSVQTLSGDDAFIPPLLWRPHGASWAFFSARTAE